MCIEDIRIGRRTKTTRYRVSVPAGRSLQLLPPNADRVSLFIPSTASSASIGIDTSDLGSVTEGTILTAYQAIRFSLASDGQLVTFGWFAMNSGISAHLITYFETVLMEA